MTDQSGLSNRSYKDQLSLSNRSYKTRSIELFHEQLPLPVPCYDFFPVTELTLGRAKRAFRVFPAPLK